MAVSSIFNSLTYGGGNSADYGIYITGEAVYNAPKRAVDMVNVPGRNGAIAIDQGRWENIEIEYPAGTFGMDAEEFGTALSNFRNAIVSQIGYQRLTDTYHPDEYRMAMYVSGLDVSPKHYNSAGEFNLTFNCKPQRWLANGETAIVVASGDTLTNPTPYDAGPLLAVEGYGNIDINGYDIAIDDGFYGELQLYPAGTLKYPQSTKNLDTTLYNAGDALTIPSFTVGYTAQRNVTSELINSAAIASTSGDASFSYVGNSGKLAVNVTFPAETINSASDYTKTSSCNLNVTTRSEQFTCYLTITLQFTASTQSIVYEKSTNIISASHRLMKTFNVTNDSGWNGIYADSTKSYLGEPTYIDCEIGEAYKIEGGEYISLNKYIALGSDLPVLKSGENEITLDNTITELKVKPNWWKL